MLTAVKPWGGTGLDGVRSTQIRVERFRTTGTSLTAPAGPAVGRHASQSNLLPPRCTLPDGTDQGLELTFLTPLRIRFWDRSILLLPDTGPQPTGPVVKRIKTRLRKAEVGFNKLASKPHLGSAPSRARDHFHLQPTFNLISTKVTRARLFTSPGDSLAHHITPPTGVGQTSRQSRCFRYSTEGTRSELPLSATAPIN